MHNRPITRQLHQYEELTKNTPIEDCEMHHKLLAARRSLEPFLVYEGITSYNTTVMDALRNSWEIMGWPPYPEFFGGF